MNKMLSTVEFFSLIDLPVMSKREKLLRFAHIVRASKEQFVIFSNIEFMTPGQLSMTYHPGSAFAAAAADPILKDAGLKSDRVSEAARFFDLTREELHEFSCDCGGLVSNEEMARRIERIANK